MIPASVLYPRSVSMFGSENSPSLVASASLPGTQGILCLQAPDGNEFYIFMDGQTPAFGGVNEVMAGTIGTVGCDIGPPVVPAAPSSPAWRDFMSTIGSQRVSSSIAISGNPVSGYSGALAMLTGHGTIAAYMYLFNTGANTWQLCVGTEAQFLGKVAGTALVGTPVVGSGALGFTPAEQSTRRDGRTIIGNSRADNIRLPGVMFIQSSGRGAGYAMESGEMQMQGGMGVVMYFPDPIAAPLFVQPDAWLTWNGS